MAAATATALPYVPLTAYNETIATGGDSLTLDLNLPYDVSRTRQALLKVCNY
jgi:hypothetical protein